MNLPSSPSSAEAPADGGIAVVDYGGGNLGSLVSALERRGAEFCVTADADVVARAQASILPGDGAFGATMDALRARGLDRAIRAVIEAGRPFLGICVGMQILYERSNEHGDFEGLGIFPGSVTRFVAAPRVPHMGWNELEIVRAHPFVANLPPRAYAYFLHSYRAPVDAATVAAATHGERFAAIEARDNVMATQFHPEKSQATGAVLLDNFIAICNAA
ncbi:MAG: imidazole glycerol phosphate synthase subunit HisH [Candidatus Eremiobacteraeota bacterium]|nr:imidazole glycerol phosphate synthase subunit HisH [Candidatus Eremiobacteraeota bacterium]